MGKVRPLQQNIKQCIKLTIYSAKVGANLYNQPIVNTGDFHPKQ